MISVGYLFLLLDVFLVVFHMKQLIKDRLLAELELLRRPFVYGTLIFTAIVQWMHNTAHNYVYYLAGQYGVYGGRANMLTDLGFKGLDWLPNLSNVSNIMLYCIAALAAVVLGSVSFTNFFIKDVQVHTMQALVRACWVCCLSVFLRVVSFLITILPSPAGHCSRANFNPPETVADIFFHFDVGRGCSDLIFSSHQMYGLVAVCALHHYLIVGNKNGNKLVKWIFILIGWTFVLIEAISIVRQRSHYSIDVWNALYAVPFAWMSIAYVFPNDVKVVTSDAKQLSHQSTPSTINV
jgi:hypothetical protein